MKLKIIVPLGLVVLLAAVAAYKILGDSAGSETRRQNIPVVIVEKPLREKITQRIQLTGDVIAVQQASIFSKVSGTLD
jgi:hypothetical protein